MEGKHKLKRQNQTVKLTSSHSEALTSYSGKQLLLELNSGINMDDISIYHNSVKPRGQGKDGEIKLVIKPIVLKEAPGSWTTISWEWALWMNKKPPRTSLQLLSKMLTCTQNILATNTLAVTHNTPGL